MIFALCFPVKSGFLVHQPFSDVPAKKCKNLQPDGKGLSGRAGGAWQSDTPPTRSLRAEGLGGEGETAMLWTKSRETQIAAP